MKEQEVINEAMSTITKKYGEGAIMRLGDKSNMKVEAISTGLLSLDKAIGIGGVPKGRIIELYAQEGTGKTTLALHIVANAQKSGGLAAYVDAEHALDPEYINNLGIDADNLLVSQPSSGEEALEITDTLVRSGKVAVVVVDSVAALVPQAELNGEMGDAVMGLQARLMAQAMRKLTAAVAQSGTCLIFINQLRDKIGVTWGSPTVTTGGKSLKFYASVRMELSRIGQLKEGEKVVGSRTRIKVVKNKVGPPFREVEVDLMFGEGFSSEGDLIDTAIKAGVIEQKGSWFSFGDTRLGQGKENVRNLLKTSPNVKEQVLRALDD